MEDGKHEAAVTGLKHALDRWVDYLHEVRDERNDLRRRLKLLLQHVGDADACPTCGAEIFWVRHPREGLDMPYDASGRAHFSHDTQAAGAVLTVGGAA